jgi:type I restriction enzyme S subunit
MGGSAGQQRVQADFFPHFRIPRIEPSEQCRIAAVLDTVDEAIAKTEAVIAKLRQVRAGLLHDLLTRGLDHHGQLRDPIAHPEQFHDSPLGQIPRAWSVQKLDDMVRIIDCKHYTPKFVKEGKAFIRPRNVKPEGLDFSDIDFVTDEDFALLTDKHVPRLGDIVFSRNATFGVACYVDQPVPFAIGQDTVVMTEKAASTHFVYFVLRSSLIETQVMRVSTGSTFGRINLAFIRSLLLPRPEPPEQVVIVERMVAFDQQLKAEAVDLTKLHQLKAGLMTDLLTGRVRVPAKT